MSSGRKFMPIIGHWNANTFLLNGGGLGAIITLNGYNFELMDEAATDTLREAENQLALNTNNARLEWWRHFIRIGKQKMPRLPPPEAEWAKALDASIYEHYADNVSVNMMFFTIILRPRRRTFYPGAQLEAEFEEIVRKTLEQLHTLWPRRIGFRFADPSEAHLPVEQRTIPTHSEIAETYHVIMNGFARPIPIPAGTERLNRNITPYRVLFFHRDGLILHEGGKTWFVMLKFTNYPSHSHPVMMEALKEANLDFTMTNSFLHSGSNKALQQINAQTNALGAARDSKTQKAGLEKKQEDLKNNAEVYGSHHFSICVRASSQAELDEAVYKVQDLVSKGRATVDRFDDKAIKAAYFAQLPGNALWRARIGGTSSRCYASYAALNNVPTAPDRSIWGPPIFYIRTTKNTLYPWHFQVMGAESLPAEDVGSWFTVGGTGSGKTTGNNVKTAFASRVGARVVTFDKDFGCAPLFLACNGTYFEFRNGEDTGVNMLAAAKATPEWLNHLHQAFLALIESDGRGAIPIGDENDLVEEIKFQLALPRPQDRAIDGIWPLLPGQENGTGARLRRWGRKGPLGWAFDGAKGDLLSFNSNMIGMDTTALLDNPLVCESMLNHLFFRLRAIINLSKPLVISLDECWKTIGNNPGDMVDNRRLVGTFDDYSRTIRKNNGVIGLITHSAGSFINSHMARSIQTNFPTKEFYADPNARHDDLVKYFGLSEKEFELVTKTLPNRRHSFLVHRPGGSFVGVNNLSKIPNRITVLSGRGATYQLCRALQERCGEENSRAWIADFEHLAPMVIRNPQINVRELVFGKVSLAA